MTTPIKMANSQAQLLGRQVVNAIEVAILFYWIFYCNHKKHATNHSTSKSACYGTVSSGKHSSSYKLSRGARSGHTATLKK